MSGEVDGELAASVSEIFTEILLAPGFTQEARDVFSEKPNLRLLQGGYLAHSALSAKHVTGGLLLQEADRMESTGSYEVVTKVRPAKDQMRTLLFAWRVARTVKSNAIVLAKDESTVGVGAGQMSRVESAGDRGEQSGMNGREVQWLPATPFSRSPTGWRYWRRPG